MAACSVGAANRNQDLQVRIVLLKLSEQREIGVAVAFITRNYLLRPFGSKRRMPQFDPRRYWERCCNGRAVGGVEWIVPTAEAKATAPAMRATISSPFMSSLFLSRYNVSTIWIYNSGCRPRSVSPRATACVQRR